MNGCDLITVLNAIEHKENRKLVSEHLAAQFQAFDAKACVGPQEEEGPLLRVLNDGTSWDAPLDLVIVDGLGLRRWEREILATKEAERPRFLPILFIAQDKDLGLATKNLWQAVDEVVCTPIRKVELNARVAVLVRARLLSKVLDRKNHELKTFLYLMAHDLRAPLRAITGFSELLQEEREKELPRDVIDLLAKIRRSSTDMVELMEAVLRIVRLEKISPFLGPVDMAEVMAEVLDRLRDERVRRRAHVTGPDDWPTVLGAKPLLVSLFQNILSNALKYTAPGTPPRITLSWQAFPWGYRFSVTDNGIGIPEEKIPEIFKPFRRLHGSEEYPGIGLGLTAVKRVVDMLHGRILVRSRVGAGTTFLVDLMRYDHVENPAG
ncbi:MAG: hybrid sensor histidine kinase/response regulator [Desulfosoma sp.]